MDNRKNFFLLLLTNVNTFQRFSCSAIRTEQRLIIYSGKSRRLVVGLSASWADFNLGNTYFFHGELLISHYIIPHFFSCQFPICISIWQLCSTTANPPIKISLILFYRRL